MKKNVFNGCLGLLSFFIFSACLGDNNDIHVSYGVVRNFNSANDYEILTDKGNTLQVSKSHSSQTIENGKRVLVNFEILSDKEKNKKIYEVMVNGFYYLLSKGVVYESFILENEEVRRDSIGNDPFIHVQAGFGGDYINIDFNVYFEQYSSVKHVINLVYDDTRNNADTLCLALYHNAFGEIPGNDLLLQQGIGRSSFKIADLLPQGVTSIPVKITWKEYAGGSTKIRSTSGIYKVGNTSEQSNRLEQQISFDSSIETR